MTSFWRAVRPDRADTLLLYSSLTLHQPPIPVFPAGKSGLNVREPCSAFLNNSAPTTYTAYSTVHSVETPTSTMASGAQQQPGEPTRHHVGEHWSGANPVPTVQKFIEHLDEEKKERDKRIDDENQAKTQAKKEEDARKKEKERRGEDPNETDSTGEVSKHKPREVSQAKIRTVTDPTTGKDIGVEDQDEESMETVKNPMVRISGIADTNTSLT